MSKKDLESAIERLRQMSADDQKTTISSATRDELIGMIRALEFGDPLFRLVDEELMGRWRIDFPADGPKMVIRGQTLNIATGDGYTARSYTYEGLIEMITERQKLIDRNRDLELQVNARNPDEFLPKLIYQIDDLHAAAVKAGDTPRAEAYASSSLLIRSFLRREEIEKLKRRQVL